MISIDDAKSIIQHEYGKNISVFMIADESEEIEEHELFFIQNFSNIIFSNSYDEAQKYWNKSNTKFDLVVIYIKDNSKSAEKLLRNIRDDEELINIIAFTSDKQTHDYIVEHCYCADATMPYPFDSEYVFKYLHRYLKRIIIAKEMNSYVTVLENLINPKETVEEPAPFVGVDRRNRDNGSIKDRAVADEEPKNNKRRIEDNKLKNIRFNQSHKITANDFLQTLDLTIVDKVEEFQEELDNYAMLLYDIENIDAAESMQKIEKVSDILVTFADMVGAITAFPIIEETFRELTKFLAFLEVSNFEDATQKKLLVEVLLGLGYDLELWIKAIFIDQSTEDIHYFDASFANNCLEIEALFHQDEFEEDDGDLEFF